MDNIKSLFDVNDAYQCLTTEMIESDSVTVEHLQRFNALIQRAGDVPVNSTCEKTKHKMIGIIIFVRDSVAKALKS